MTFTVFWHNFDTTEKNVLSKIQILKPLLQKNNQRLLEFRTDMNGVLLFGYT